MKKLKTKMHEIQEGDYVFLSSDIVSTGKMCVQRVQKEFGNLFFMLGAYPVWLYNFNNDMTHPNDPLLNIMCAWTDPSLLDGIWKGDNYDRDRARIKKYFEILLSNDEELQ